MTGTTYAFYEREKTKEFKEQRKPIEREKEKNKTKRKENTSYYCCRAFPQGMRQTLENKKLQKKNTINTTVFVRTSAHNRNSLPIYAEKSDLLFV